ncbi:hypothetical protein LTR94_029898, partial [Friedmanniomyces endolithicus]
PLCHTRADGVGAGAARPVDDGGHRAAFRFRRRGRERGQFGVPDRPARAHPLALRQGASGPLWRVSPDAMAAAPVGAVAAGAGRYRFHPRPRPAHAGPDDLRPVGGTGVLRDHLFRPCHRPRTSPAADLQPVERGVVRHLGSAAVPAPGAAARDRGRAADRARHTQQQFVGDLRRRRGAGRGAAPSRRGDRPTDPARARADAVRATGQCDGGDRRCHAGGDRICHPPPLAI